MGNREGGRRRRLDYARPAFVALILLLLGLGLALGVVPVKVHAETVFPGGHIVETTETWDVDGSPYIVEGSLSVRDSGHLILEPGVEVQIMGGGSLRSRLEAR
jgi:hypothetical protein